MVASRKARWLAGWNSKSIAVTTGNAQQAGGDDLSVGVVGERDVRLRSGGSATQHLDTLGERAELGRSLAGAFGADDVDLGPAFLRQFDGLRVIPRGDEHVVSIGGQVAGDRREDQGVRRVGQIDPDFHGVG